MTVDTLNRYMVATQGEKIFVMRPPREMTKEEALGLAAWLVAIADPMQKEFSAYLAAVLAT